MIDIFGFESYKTFLLEYVKTHRRPGLMLEMANAAGCDRTYLSQVLSSKVQLTPDHALSLTEYFSFDESREDYFLSLVLKERSSNPSISRKLTRKLKKLKESNFTLSKKVQSLSKPRDLSEVQKEVYYSSWHHSAIHLLTGIPQFQTVDALAERLQISRRKVSEMLKRLEEFGLVKHSNQRWVYYGGDIHIPKSSIYSRLNHTNWRLKALDQLSLPESIHYTSVFSVSSEDAEKIKRLVFEFIEHQRKVIAPSANEELLCFCCDLFTPQ